MEKKKSIIDWVNSLGFRLPSGSTLSRDDFRVLLATPNRRKLWVLYLSEKVEPRKRVEFIRKGILAHWLTGGRFGKEELVPELSLWEKQKALETNVTVRRNDISKLEKRILTKSSDLLMEICKLAELEKQYEEYKEKKLILKLCTQRQKKILAELELIMKSSELGFLDHCYQKVNNLKEEIDESNHHHSTVPSESNNSSRKEESPWEEIINWKINFHKQFENLLQEIKSNERRNLSKNMSQIEENLNSALIELKQKVTEKALQLMVNTKEGKKLNLKIQELMNKSEEIYQKDESFTSSFYTPLQDKEKQLEIFTKHAKVLALRSYRDFLEEELLKLDEQENQEFQDGREKFELKMKTMNAVSNEIHKLKLQREKLSNDIMTRHDELQILLNLMREQKEDACNKSVEETITSLKATFKKQIEIFMETPFDAFRKVETSSGRIAFECESLNHCLNNYGGEFKDFFTSMLIPPTRNVSQIIAELEKRKKVLGEVKEFISNWENLIQHQKNIQHSLNSIKMESKIYEKNFDDAKGILWQNSNKLKQICPEISFLKKILKNWMEQPYRFMIKETETLNGLTLKEYEETYSKEDKK